MGLWELVGYLATGPAIANSTQRSPTNRGALRQLAPLLPLPYVLKTLRLDAVQEEVGTAASNPLESAKEGVSNFLTKTFSNLTGGTNKAA